MATKAATLAVLRERLADWTKKKSGEDSALAPNVPGLERLLPGGGYQPHSLVEWLAEGGSGATTLALATARSALGEDKPLVVVDLRGDFYPPPAIEQGISPLQMVIVRPANERDAAWAWEQSLRCSAVGAVLGWVDRIDGRTARRWQLAVEKGATLGLLLRPPRAMTEPCWAAVRWRVEPSPKRNGRMRVELVRCRNGTPGGAVEVELPHDSPQAFPGRLAAELAVAASIPRPTGA